LQYFMQSLYRPNKSRHHSINIFLTYLIPMKFRCSRHKKQKPRSWLESLKPEPLPSSRSNISTTTLAIPQNGPFFKLPLEIRLMIFELLLGGGTIHIILLRQGYGHRRCPRGTHPDTIMDGDLRRYCFDKTTLEMMAASERYPFSEIYSRRDKGFGESSSANSQILRTCRKAYLEGIDILYSRNRFDFIHPQALNWWCEGIRPQRLATIRYVQLFVEAPTVYLFDPMEQFKDDWTKMWRTASELMTDLREFRIVVRFLWGYRERLRGAVDEALNKLTVWALEYFSSKSTTRFAFQFSLSVDDYFE
jgi:hypothetical protein